MSIVLLEVSQTLDVLMERQTMILQKLPISSIKSIIEEMDSIENLSVMNK